MSKSKNFKAYFGAGFAMADDLPEFYVEACEEVPEMLADDEDGSYRAFRDEFAAHIRDSSYAPWSAGESQWTTDEWLRNVWYDAFGPEPAPGDPYPVPTDDWGRRRLTEYMVHAVRRTPERSSPVAAWLEARGLTFEDVAAGIERSATMQSVSFRPAPEGWLDRLHDLTERGLRAEQPGER